MNLDALLTVEESATLLGVSPRTVRRWVADGVLVTNGGTRGRAKLYLVREVYEAEMLVRTGVSTSSRCAIADRVSQ